MRDEDFDVFIDEFGEASERFEVPSEIIERWHGRVPNQLLTYWKEEGWCSYAQGLVWTLNPEDYQDILAAWIEGTPFEDIDNYAVFARSAFGDLYACGPRTGASLTVACSVHGIVAVDKALRPKSEEKADSSIRSFFAGSRPSAFDLEDDDGNYLFSQALEKLGPLASDEVYGFEPAIILGGKMALESLQKVKLHQHLMMLRQLARPNIPFSDIDIDRLMQS